MEKLPKSLLNGSFLRCRPVYRGQIVTAQIIHSDENENQDFKATIFCPALICKDLCQLRVDRAGSSVHCHYYRSESDGEYQIVGIDAGQHPD